MIDEWVDLLAMLAIGGDERWFEDTVETHHFFQRVFGGEQFVDECLERQRGADVHTWRRIAHLAHARAQRIDMLGVEIHMEAERLLHFPLRRRIQPGQPDLQRLLFEPGVADEALDILLDGIAQPRGLVVRA